MRNFFVYMMTNKSRVVLYTGVANYLERRVWEHQNSELPGSTKTYKVNRLVYYQDYDNPLDPIAREKEIKGWRRSKKNTLVETLHPKWPDLSAELFEPLRGPSHPLGMTERKK